MYIHPGRPSSHGWAPSRVGRQFNTGSELRITSFQRPLPRRLGEARHERCPVRDVVQDQSGELCRRALMRQRGQGDGVVDSHV